MSEENKVPSIRFKRFSGEWGEKKLGEVCLVGDIDHRMPPSVKDGIPYLMTGDFFGINNLDFENAKLISVENYEQLSKKIKPERGDILFARYASVGAVRYVETDSKFTISYSCAILKNSTTFLDSRYLYYYLQSNQVQYQIELEINTGSQRNIGIDSLKKLVVNLPENREQLEVSCFLKSLDTLIVQHQQKHAKLLNIKKALLEKMFPKQGATEPEIRFKGFSGKWEVKVLGDVITFINGRAYSQDELLTKGKYPVVRVGNFYTNSSWYYSDLELGEKYYANNDDLLYTWSASFGPHIWKGGKVIYHYHIWKLLLSQKLECSFLLHVLNKDRDNILAGSNGSTMIHITKEGMEKKSILIPEKKEQNKIGDILDSLDTLINQHQSQLKKLYNIKQACLEKMFV